MSQITESNTLRDEKKRKLNLLLEKGLNPYPHQFKKTHHLQDIQKKYKDIKTGESLKSEMVKTAGRLMLKRTMGKAVFFNIQDQETSLQCYLKTEELDKTSLDFFSLVDIGDIVGLQAWPFRTRKGELTLRCQKFQILCKSVRPLPEKYHGLEDKELKYRQRYLDLIMNPEAKKVFLTRCQVIKELRAFLDKKGFLEVDTPALQPIYGGALAQPFSTHHRALNCPLYLKISPELYLKRLIVGGFEKVYELGKNFRNEGIDRSHNPEFMMLEYYEAYTDYLDQIKQFEELVCHVVQKVKGSLKWTYQGKELDWTPPWQKMTVEEAIYKKTGVATQDLDNKALFAKIKLWGSDLEEEVDRGTMLMSAFDLKVEKELWDPVFIIDFPKEVSPLTKEHRLDHNKVERFEPFVAGMEIGNAYTELNDPIEQKTRLKKQVEQRKKTETAHPMDQDFIQAMEVGMPPTGGVGLGVERLILLLADQPSLRDIILFPTLKPLSS